MLPYRPRAGWPRSVGDLAGSVVEEARLLRRGAASGQGGCLDFVVIPIQMKAYGGSCRVFDTGRVTDPGSLYKRNINS